jgi:ribonuclease VapC
VIVDSSALVAVVFQEPGYERLLEKLAASTSTAIGTPTLVEVGVVLRARLGLDPRHLVAGLVQELHIEEVPFGARHWQEAIGAFHRFGRGQHTAKLNFGDCLTYAVASLADEPLLFVGDDFAATDLIAA